MHWFDAGKFSLDFRNRYVCLNSLLLKQKPRTYFSDRFFSVTSTAHHELHDVTTEMISAVDSGMMFVLNERNFASLPNKPYYWS